MITTLNEGAGTMLGIKRLLLAGGLMALAVGCSSESPLAPVSNPITLTVIDNQPPTLIPEGYYCDGERENLYWWHEDGTSTIRRAARYEGNDGWTRSHPSNTTQELPFSIGDTVRVHWDSGDTLLTILEENIVLDITH
jgi:hypothetical protein